MGIEDRPDDTRDMVKDANAAVSQLSCDDQAYLDAVRIDARVLFLLTELPPDELIGVLKVLHPEAEEALNHLKDFPLINDA